MQDFEQSLGQPIAYGRTAQIYAWENNQILKLFYDWFPLENIEHEAQIARAVRASGIPSPAAGEILRINERNGLVYERVAGISMWDILGKKPWLYRKYAHKMAALHAEMHTKILDVEVPSQRKKLTQRIHTTALPAHLQSRALSMLESLPGGERLCHGDFHPGNILATSTGEVIIDWIDASRGNPLADVARTTILILGAAETTQISNPVMKVFAHWFHAAYLQHYFNLQPGGKLEYHRWLPVVAAARLAEEIPEVQEWLLNQVKQGAKR